MLPLMATVQSLKDSLNQNMFQYVRSYFHLVSLPSEHALADLSPIPTMLLLEELHTGTSPDHSSTIYGIHPPSWLLLLRCHL